MAHLFFILSHCERLRILKLLALKGDLLFQDIEQDCPLTRPTLSGHLRRLVTSGLVNPVAIGTKSGYSLNRELWQEGLEVMRQYLDSTEGRYLNTSVVQKSGVSQDRRA